jgi:hypothetical protein
MKRLAIRGRIYPNSERIKPSGLGVGVTVCLCVACDCGEQNPSVNPKLIMASDTLLSMGITSTEVLKGRALAPSWGVMIAGDDLTYAEQAISAVRLTLKGKTATYREVAMAMTRSYQDVRRSQIEDVYLSSYGMDMATFLQQGPDFPSTTKRQSILDDIDKFDLGCEFLVSGFRPDNPTPRIFEVHNPGRFIPQNLLGYSAIGSGATNAISYLARRSQRDRTTLGTSIYNAIAAKRLAEKALGVGDSTVVYILEYGKYEQDDLKWLSKGQIIAITTMWEKEEAFIRPHNLEERICSIVNPGAAKTASSSPT